MENTRTYITGYVLAAVSALAYSAKGIFVKILYSYGVDPVTVLALRFVAALPFFWITLFFYPSGKVGARELFFLVLSGLMGLYVAAMADFYGLLYIDASLERIILYTYPAMIAVWTAVFFKEKLSSRKLLSMALTYTGLVLALKLFGGFSGVNLTGAGLILFSAVVYSLSYILTEILGRRVSGVKISAYTTTAACFAALGTWHGKSLPHQANAWIMLFLLSIISTYIPVLTLALGIKRIGASRAAIVSFIGPVSTAVLAYLILGEKMDLIQIAGMCLVIIGVLVISTERYKGIKAGQGS